MFKYRTLKCRPSSIGGPGGVGFTDNDHIILSTNGVFMWFTSGTAGQLTCYKNGSASTDSFSYPSGFAGKLVEVVWKEDRADVYIDNVLVASVTSNIPDIDLHAGLGAEATYTNKYNTVTVNINQR